MAIECVVLLSSKAAEYNSEWPQLSFVQLRFAHARSDNYCSWFGQFLWDCDPDCLVQPPNSRIAPKSIGEGASSLFGGWPGSPENVSCSGASPRLHRCKSGVAQEQETFSGLPGHPPNRLLAPSPIDLGAIREFGGCTRQSGSQLWEQVGLCMAVCGCNKRKRHC